MDGQETTPVVQDQTMESQASTPSEPVDIAQAFQMLRDADKTPAETAEPETPVVPEPTTEPEPVAPTEPAVPVEPAHTGGYNSSGGSSDPMSNTEYQTRQQELASSIVQYARQQATEDFQKNGVKRWSIKDLHHRDEDGRVSFIDPDTGEDLHTRDRAQQWINSMNAQIDESYNEKVREISLKMMQNAKPAFELLQFAPTYQTMNPTVKQVFDDIIEPYALGDEAGNIIGFGCDLNAAYRQAINIVNRFTKQQQPKASEKPQPTQPATTPAMDIKTGSGQSPESEEPKNINEAMMMLNKMKKGQQNG